MSELIESNKSIRPVIYGARTIGGVVGSHLVLAGKEVILIGRPERFKFCRSREPGVLC